MPRWRQKFIAQPPLAVISMVREFYSNLDVASSMSIVRGGAVAYNSDAIRSLFDLPWIQENSYQDNLENVDHVIVSDSQCPTGTQWKYDQSQSSCFLRAI